MAKKGSVQMNIDKLKQVYEALKTKPNIQVGVFTGKAARSDGPLTNADLASCHEHGSPKHGLPARSMLKIPIHDHITDVMKPFRDNAEKALVSGQVSVLRMYKLVGIAAEKIVAQAFATGGFGKWPILKYKTLLGKLKGSLSKRRSKILDMYAGNIGMGILIKTGQLKRAFSSRVRMRI